ncbi:MAG: zinc-dependent alcohol dehydrogenase family protein [Chloroflexi bacterium]|nr:zinc-dependent alcohol dehydrogenase family protein [Chloroflexota bacterium]HOC20487.1 zinc-dependent alcohol dehydrogenase family protein [Anaerolineae bacterium]HQM13414.1 zinc-dependent alcohol dehydrogenase family protein [Anaerolineae bacterium]HUM37836.1 zinc-dependent alcohol dehydrogenase family protein [Anaerolineae bacterium]
MDAMVLHAPGAPLTLERLPVPRPASGQVLIRVRACGVCRTDLHVFDGDLPHPKLPLILGHEIVGEVVAAGAGVTKFEPGARVGVPWLGYTDGTCRFCLQGQENLCEAARFTGYTLDGGYAEYAVADARYTFPLGEGDPAEQAPLLCAGLIGYRAYRLAGENARRIGLYGFGAAAHILAQLAVYQGREIYAFTRPGDRATQAFARQLGAVWAGDSDALPPEPLDAAILFAPVGALVPLALQAVTKGGVVVCAGIHMSDVPAFPYRLLWEERHIRSVANLTRQDGEEFLALAPRVPVRTTVRRYPLAAANIALDDLRHGRFEGAAVLDFACEAAPDAGA